MGYYYLQTIAWTTTFPIVPGLGNLLLNLGFNQSPFLVASLFDSLGPHLWGYSLLGGLLPWLGLTLSGFALLQGVCAVLSIRKRLEPIEKAYAISLPAWIYTLLVNNISSNSPDIPSACLQIHLFLCFASFLAAAKESQTILSEFGELIVLGALSLCVKLNSIFFVAAIGLLSLGVALTRIGAPRLLGSKQLLYAALAALVLYLPWTARGIIISGYPLFPSTVLAAPVAWRVPKADVSHFYDITVYWGRQPYYDLAKVQSGFAWVPEWLQRIWGMKDQFARPLSLGALVDVAIDCFAWKTRNFRQRLHPLAANDSAGGIRFGHVVLHRSRSKISWVDHLASAARCLACLDFRDFAVSQPLSSRSLSASITLLLARCAITPSGPGRNGLLASRRFAE